jgi:Protein of unknown function (DUF1236)
MRKELLITVSALTLIASAGISAAQEKAGPGGAGRAPAAQSPSAAQPSNEPAGRMDRDGQPSQQPRQDDFRDNRAQSDQPAQPKNAQSQDQRNQPAGTKDRQTQDRQQPDQRKGQQTEDRANPQRGNQTTGQGAAGRSGGAALTTEQRTKISTTIRQSNVRPVTNVRFNIAIGTAVPRDVTLHPLPAAVIEVYPEWRPYRFVLVGNEILVIDPATHEIVAILEA